MTSIDKKISDKRCGVGGYKCGCCGPAPRHRKRFNRQIKRGPVKEFIRQEIHNQKEE